MSESHWATPEEVAKRWKVSKMTVYRLAQQGELSSIRVGRSIRISQDSVLAYEQRGRTDAQEG